MKEIVNAHLKDLEKCFGGEACADLSLLPALRNQKGSSNRVWLLERSA